MATNAGVFEGYQPFPDVPRRNVWQEHLEVPVMARALRLPRGGRVLEVGCGRGVALPVLARELQPSWLVGLDADAALLRQAASRLGRRTELVLSDVRCMPFPDAFFDLVVDFGTCYHIARPSRALGEIARVLVPGGLLAHETRLSQLLSHPLRARGRRLPWSEVPGLQACRAALLWASRRKASMAGALFALALAAGTPAAARCEEQPATPPAVAPAPAAPGPAAAGSTRLLFAPTARSAAPGDGVAGVTEIAFPWLEFGVVDRVSVLVGGVPPLEDLTSAGVVLGPKVQVLRHGPVQLAAGVMHAFGTSYSGGVGYGVATLGGTDAALSVGYGYVYGDLVESSPEFVVFYDENGQPYESAYHPYGSRGLVFLGAEKAVGRRVRLMLEAYLGGEQLGLPDQTLFGAVRLNLGPWLVDLGVVQPFYETGSGTPFPVLTVARRF
jgi:SAM-dependent methyltransferase